MPPGRYSELNGPLHRMVRDSRSETFRVTSHSLAPFGSGIACLSDAGACRITQYRSWGDYGPTILTPTILVITRVSR